MKKILLAVLTSMVVLSAQAGDYLYLTFETTDGVKASVSVKSLSISIDGTTLTAGNKKFALTNLGKMYFSKDDETTGISSEKISREELATATFYDLQGHQVDKNQMGKGIYVVKTKNGAYKLTVK